MSKKPRQHSQETKDKISKALKGRKYSEEHKLAISKGRQGQEREPRTQETKDKISEAMSKSASRGKDHYLWWAFELIVESPQGEVTTHLYNGDTPLASCCKDFNLGMGDILYKLRLGEEWVVKRRTMFTKHPFKVGTTITLRELKLI